MHCKLYVISDKIIPISKGGQLPQTTKYVEEREKCGQFTRGDVTINKQKYFSLNLRKT